jgi:hypothetical protein
VLYQVIFSIIRVIDRYGTWVNPGHLLGILLDRDGRQDILLFGPSDRYAVLRALAILMPCLGETIGYIVGLIIQASWVVIRHHLKGMMEHQ